MRFPVDDWQFWVVTAIALLAAVWLLRPLIPGLRKRRARSTQRVTLTIGGNPTGKRVR